MMVAFLAIECLTVYSQSRWCNTVDQYDGEGNKWSYNRKSINLLDSYSYVPVVNSPLIVYFLYLVVFCDYSPWSSQYHIRIVMVNQCSIYIA